MIVQPIAQPICRAIAVGVGTSTGGGSAPSNSLPPFQVDDVVYSHPTGTAGTEYVGAIPSPAVAAATLEQVLIGADNFDGLLTGELPIAGLTVLTAWQSYGNIGLTGSPDISGCSALAAYNIAGCGHSGTLSALPATMVAYVVNGNSFSGVAPAFNHCTSLQQYLVSDNPITSWAGSSFPASARTVRFDGCALDQSSVNALIDAAYAASWLNDNYQLWVNNGTNAVPSAPQIVKAEEMNLAGALILYNT